MRRDADAAPEAIARARGMVEFLNASAERIEAGRALPADVVAALHEARHVSPAAAALAGRRRVAPQDAGPGDRGDRRCRRQHGLVPGPGRGLRDGGGQPEARGRAAPVRACRCRARLGRRHPGQGARGRRRLSRHRQMDLRQRLRQRHAARRPQLHLREGRHAPQARRRQPGSTAPCCSSSPRPRSTTCGTRSASGARRATPTRSRTCSCPRRRPSTARTRRRPSSRARSICSPRRYAYAAAFSALMLGLAQAMVSDLKALAMTKTPRASASSLKESPVFQSQLAVLEARLRAARAYLHTTLDEIWDKVEATREIADRGARQPEARHHLRHQPGRRRSPPRPIAPRARPPSSRPTRSSGACATPCPPRSRRKAGRPTSSPSAASCWACRPTRYFCGSRQSRVPQIAFSPGKARRSAGERVSRTQCHGGRAHDAPAWSLVPLGPHPDRLALCARKRRCGSACSPTSRRTAPPAPSAATSAARSGAGRWRCAWRWRPPPAAARSAPRPRRARPAGACRWAPR